MDSGNMPHIAVFGLKGFPAIGGTASVGENLVKELNKKFHFTIYATSSHCKERQPYSNVRMFIIKKFLPHKLNVFYFNLVGALHALLFAKYNLVHTHQIDTGFIVPILRLRYKVVSTHHGKTYDMDKWGYILKRFFRISEWLMIKTANWITFVSDKEKSDAECKFRQSNFTTIYNGINLDQKVNNHRCEDNYIMFAAGRIIPLKGCHILLEALKKSSYKGKLVIAGDLEQIPSYGKKIRKYATGLNVEFVGMLFDKADLLGYVKNASFFIFPSYTEAMSLMLLEAALVKTPIICSDIEANKAIFGEGEVEFFKVGNVDDLADRINVNLKDSDACKLKSDRAYLKLLMKYQWRQLASQYEELYLFNI